MRYRTCRSSRRRTPGTHRPYRRRAARREHPSAWYRYPRAALCASRAGRLNPGPSRPRLRYPPAQLVGQQAQGVLHCSVGLDLMRFQVSKTLLHRAARAQISGRRRPSMIRRHRPRRREFQGIIVERLNRSLIRSLSDALRFGSGGEKLLHVLRAESQERPSLLCKVGRILPGKYLRGCRGPPQSDG